MRLVRLISVYLSLATVAHADVQSVMPTSSRWACTAPDGSVVSTSSRDDIVFAACANAVNTTKLTHRMVGAGYEVRYVVPAVPEPEPQPDPVQPSPEPPARYVGLTPTCPDPGSIGQLSCQLPPTIFSFPTPSSIVKSDGTWLVFGSLADNANVLVCSVEQVPGSIADPYRTLCLTDTYLPKAAVRLSASTEPPVTGSAKLTWAAPTTNTDDSALTDLAGYRVQWGTDTNAMDRTASVPASTNEYEVTGLPAGVWVFGVRAVNSQGSESALSNTLSRVIQ